ncbi:hypothetical protein THASP1DRAFT_29096 [Thamnocephalis sphaerospora]|uniref:Uncharacterized protein n=1 Tax=Thamnocephalis sphaerospora TaxID=78915 RepID=A0A4P9XSK1_9FUNG|nr:hypothetical protein THASP1DRAFT_29096 [Thamnocephalis sphaerospora]|eukprot:RKP09107.1 hypothetical protein THASP1DRAFT_29096 [Thamnocephalis sphaerospora]
MAIRIPISDPLDNAITALHALSLIGTFAVIYVNHRLQQWLVVRFAILLALYHLCLLVCSAMYGAAVIHAPSPVCIIRKGLLAYTSRGMQCFAAGFALRLWYVLAGRETAALSATHAWRRLDRWTSYTAFLVPIIPALIATVPQMVMWNSLRKSTAGDCKFGYMMRWQLIAADVIWAVPPTMTCLGLLFAGGVVFLCRYSSMLRYVRLRSFPLGMTLRTLVVCLNVGVTGVIYIESALENYAVAPGPLTAPAAPSAEKKTQYGVGNLLVALVGMLVFCAFGTVTKGRRSLAEQNALPPVSSYPHTSLKQLMHVESQYHMPQGSLSREEMPTVVAGLVVKDIDAEKYAADVHNGHLRRRSWYTLQADKTRTTDDYAAVAPHNQDADTLDANVSSSQVRMQSFSSSPPSKPFDSLGQNTPEASPKQWTSQMDDLDAVSVYTYSSTGSHSRPYESSSLPEAISSVVPMPRSHAYTISRHPSPLSYAMRYARATASVSRDRSPSPLMLPSRTASPGQHHPLLPAPAAALSVSAQHSMFSRSSAGGLTSGSAHSSTVCLRESGYDGATASFQSASLREPARRFRGRLSREESGIVEAVPYRPHQSLHDLRRQKQASDSSVRLRAPMPASRSFSPLNHTAVGWSPDFGVTTSRSAVPDDPDTPSSLAMRERSYTQHSERTLASFDTNDDGAENGAAAAAERRALVTQFMQATGCDVYDTPSATASATAVHNEQTRADTCNTAPVTESGEDRPLYAPVGERKISLAAVGGIGAAAPGARGSDVEVVGTAGAESATVTPSGSSTSLASNWQHRISASSAYRATLTPLDDVAETAPGTE